MLNVQRTVRQFIAAGAKGCILEDQKWPKKSGSMRGKEVIGLEEHVAKVGCLLTELQLCPAWEGEHCSVVQERWLQVALCCLGCAILLCTLKWHAWKQILRWRSMVVRVLDVP